PSVRGRRAERRDGRAPSHGSEGGGDAGRRLRGEGRAAPALLVRVLPPGHPERDVAGPGLRLEASEMKREGVGPRGAYETTSVFPHLGHMTSIGRLLVVISIGEPQLRQVTVIGDVAGA